MRISTAFTQYLSTTAMLAQQAKLSATQLQLSSGEKFLNPADDPSAAIRAMNLTGSIDVTEQYGKNINFARQRLELEEGALRGGLDVLQRARELTVQALNDTNTPADRRAIAQEIDQLRQALYGIANTRDAHGEYLFAGIRSQTQPFAQSTVQAPGYGYAFLGDVAVRQIQISAVRTMPESDSGFHLFEDLPSTSITAATNGGKQGILATLQLLSDALNGTLHGAAGGIVGTQDLSAGINYAAPVSFDLAVDGGPLGTVTVAAGNYADITALVAAVNLGIQSSPLNGQVTAYARGGSIQFVSATSGSGSSVAIYDSVPPSTFLADAGFGSGQQGTGQTAGTQHATLSGLLEDLDAAIARFSDVEASVGARRNAIDEQRDIHEKFVLDPRSTLSETKDLDYAEAISRFNLQQVALQAAQQSFVKVQGLSLFNYLR